MRDGSVLTWGLGESGQLGRGEAPILRPDPHSRNYDTLAAHTFHLTPQKIVFPSNNSNNNNQKIHIHAIGCGSYHGLCASRESVFSFGLNNYGQLGCDPDGVIGKVSNVPLRIVGLEAQDTTVGTICSVDGGEHHSLVMSLTGCVYSFGRGDAGELGWKDSDDSKGRVASGFFGYTPTRVGRDLHAYAVKQINCGSHHNIAVSIGGENIFAWGFGDNAALGTGKEQDEIYPTRVQSKALKDKGRKVLQVQAGSQHSLILASRGSGDKGSTEH